jgi:hypothetical protein
MRHMHEGLERKSRIHTGLSRKHQPDHHHDMHATSSFKAERRKQPEGLNNSQAHKLNIDVVFIRLYKH